MEGQHFIVLRKLFVALVAGQVVMQILFNKEKYVLHIRNHLYKDFGMKLTKIHSVTI